MFSEHYTNEVLHNPPGEAAFTSFYENGKFRRREFRVNNILSRPLKEGPAIEYFFEDGRLRDGARYVVDGLTISDESKIEEK